MSSPTITIALKRARDIQSDDVIRLGPKDRWRVVHNVAHDDATRADTDDAARIVESELDTRYVLLRVANDPVMKIGTEYGKLHSWEEHVDMRGGEPVAFGSPVEFDDRFEILGEYDLVEVQVVDSDGRPA